MYNNKYILGLDIGISSVGFGILLLDNNDNPYKILDVGSRIFPPGEIEKTGDSRAKERREKRGARRNIRRRKLRVAIIRNFLYEKGFLNTNINGNLVSERKEELADYFNEMLNNYYKSNPTNPYKLKLEALNRKLTFEELSIILVHYAKKRGYKSNREEDNNDENGKVKKSIKENKELMKDKCYQTVSEMYIKDEKFALKIKNSPNDYKVSVTREMYLEEIEKVLDSQIKYGLINEEFKNEYIKIWSSQRNYSEGPGGNSPYGGNLIEKMTGKCKFDNEPRAPKFAPSSEIFISLTKLINLRYKSNENSNYLGLEANEIKQAIAKAKEKTKLTYKDIKEIINKGNIKFKGLQLTKKEYLKLIQDLKAKLKVETVDINTLNATDKEIYDKLYEDKLFSKDLIELKGYHALKKLIINCYGKSSFEEEKDNLLLLDELALYCTNYKLDEKIKEEIEKSSIIDTKYNDDEFISGLPNFKDHLLLSTKIIRELIPLMLEGKRYDEAMKELGYDHSTENQNMEKRDLLVPINTANNITNQRVIRSLTQARKVINAIIKKYGSPKIINIETARELAKSYQERREIRKIQDERQLENEKIKKILVELGLFPSIDKISSNDLLKYKLWQEQKEFCAYSMKKISIEDLFVNNNVQIDHILPYSRTFNDNYLNKTLVFTKENQNKGDKTPYELFGNTEKWQEFTSFINNLNIPPLKKDNYLLRELTKDMEREMRTQNLNDTKYISKELSSLIKAYLNVEKVNVYQGQVTAKLRARWGLNRLTHSYLSKTYFIPDEMKIDISKDRDNHLHHAMDALVIAAITPSLQQQITFYEKFNRYIANLTKNELHELNTAEIIDKYASYYNDETGEIDEIGIHEYLKEQVSKDHIYFSEKNLARLKFPLPYEDFITEAKLRVYEQDLETLKWKLNEIHSYNTKDLANIHTLTPSIAKPKVSGAMHEETYYGMKEIDNQPYRTIKKSLDKLTLKDLESIPDKNGGSKDIYNAIKEWLGNYKDGAEALKAHNNTYPINPNDIEKKAIKKIKVYSLYKNTGHEVNGSNVDKGGIYRIDVLKSKDKTDNKLYFIAYDIFDIAKIKSFKNNNSIDFPVKLDYAQGKGNILMNYKEMLNNYDIYMILNKNDLVEITLKDDRSSIAYINGCSSGMLEVRSKIGDGYDIIGENSLFNKQRDQYMITVSQIKSIRKLKINILGEISGL